MLIKILKDRLLSINLYEKELEVDREKLEKHIKSKDLLVVKKAVELNLTITNTLSFIKIYKQKLTDYLEKNNEIAFEKYQEQFVNSDNKFFALITGYIESKDELIALTHNKE